jgi:hypothetical protein
MFGMSACEFTRDLPQEVDMAERISDTRPDGNERAGYKLELVGLAADERPSMAVQVLDAANAVL